MPALTHSTDRAASEPEGRHVPTTMHAHGTSRDATTSLPDDLLREQCVRVQALHAAGILLWAINLAMDISLTPHGDRGPYRLLIEGLGIALAAAATAFTRFTPVSSRTKISAGIACIVPHAFALGLLNSWTAQPTTMRPLSGVTVLILFFGMLAPARPAVTLATALLAASMDPLCVWLAHLRGLPVPPAWRTVVMFYPNYVCAVLAIAPARLGAGGARAAVVPHRAADPARGGRPRAGMSGEEPGAATTRRRGSAAARHGVPDSRLLGPRHGSRLVGVTPCGPGAACHRLAGRASVERSRRRTSCRPAAGVIATATR